MSFPTIPATVNLNKADFARKHGSFNVTHLGAAFTRDANPREVDCQFSKSGHEVTAFASSGAHPAFDFESFKLWMNRGRHKDHYISRLGSIASDKGTAEVYFCQDDNRICFDHVT